MSRDTFLRQVRQAVKHGRAHRVQVPEGIPERVAYQGAGADPIAKMAGEITAVGGVAHVVDDLSAARQTLGGLLSAYQVRSALCWQHEVLDQLGLDELLDARRIARLDHAALATLPASEQRAHMVAADIGITSATQAVAETGTLVMQSQPGRERLASLLPRVHVAIVRREQILGDLFDLFDALVAAGVQNLPSNLTLITGPSKTGDLELRLVTGVHGPGRWHVIIVR